jgi:hypothetical protein
MTTERLASVALTIDSAAEFMKFEALSQMYTRRGSEEISDVILSPVKTAKSRKRENGSQRIPSTLISHLSRFPPKRAVPASPAELWLKLR